jgi:TolA-binding protein
MRYRVAVAVLAGVLGLAGCAQQAARVEPPASATAPAPPTPPAAVPEPPKQADQLARIASELVELQNAIAKLMMSARQHDDQLMYLQRRIGELESQARGRAGGPQAFAPSNPGPAPLPPPPVAAAPTAPMPPGPAAPASPPVVAPPTARPVPPPAAVAAARRTSPPAPPPVSPSNPPSSDGASAEALYQEGLSKYNAGDMDGAVVTLYEVVANFPTDPMRERAQFLVGEIFYSQKDYRGVIAEMESLIAAVPGGSRVPEALVKIGLAQRALGDETRARRAWDRVVKEFPTSAAARQARSLLKSKG